MTTNNQTEALKVALTVERLNDDAEMYDRSGNNSTAEDRRARAYELSQMLSAAPVAQSVPDTAIVHNYPDFVWQQCPHCKAGVNTIAVPDTAGKDAERYRWLRSQYWNSSSLFVVAGSKSQVRLGTDCPSLDRLDAAIDAAMSQEAQRSEG